MTEAGRLKINASHLQCWSLGFVDGHGEAQLDGELYPLECKRQVAWNDRNTGDEHILTMVHPVMMVASRRFGMRYFTKSLVQLHSFQIWGQSSVSCVDQSVVVLCHIRLHLGRTVVDIGERHMISLW